MISFLSTLLNPPPRSDCNISCPRSNLRMHWWITISLGTNGVVIKTTCSDQDPDPYLKGQGHMKHLTVRAHMLLSAL